MKNLILIAITFLSLNIIKAQDQINGNLVDWGLHFNGTSTNFTNNNRPRIYTPTGTSGNFVIRPGNSGTGSSDGDVVLWDTDEFRVMNTNRIYFEVDSNNNRSYFRGQVAINGWYNDNADYDLAVNGTIGAKEVTIETNSWADFVFDKNYKLPTLEEVETYIKQNGHLKDIPTTEEVLKDGIDIAEINTKLLQKIEELTLYTIELNNKIKALENK